MFGLWELCKKEKENDRQGKPSSVCQNPTQTNQRI